MYRQLKQTALPYRLGGEHFGRHYGRPDAERPMPDRVVSRAARIRANCYLAEGFVMHTPLPWIVGTGACNDAIYSEDDIWIADCVEGSPADNAALIVRAVNCHDDLVYALRALLNANTRHEATEPDWREALAQARVALAKAEGGGE